MEVLWIIGGFLLGRALSLAVYRVCWCHGERMDQTTSSAIGSSLRQPVPWLLHGLVMASLYRWSWQEMPHLRAMAMTLVALLALGAVPGALLPQRSLNESKVQQYLATHPDLGPWLDRFQLFDVFSSLWFTAIYVLLFISLVGCLTPRTIEHIGSLRAVPVPAPRNLARLPKHATATVSGTPDAVVQVISGKLRGWRREVRHTDGATEISAEKGYLREFGNIVFHFSLLGLLVAIAVGKLFGYEGNVIVVANGGPGFCSASPAAYDSFRAGNNVDGTALYPLPPANADNGRWPAGACDDDDMAGEVGREGQRRDSSAAAGFFTTGVTTAFRSESADNPPPFDKWTLVAVAEDETATDGGLRLRG
jgi:cytochrome c biogenesis protein ResB